jgi:hypothetical protein
LCLIGASYTHVRIVLAYGLDWDYGGLPLSVCVFWTALTFLDPLAVLLLLVRPKVGLGLTVAIIVSDVAINTWVAATYGFDWASFFAQFLFLIFVLMTGRIAWAGIPAAHRPSTLA